MLKRCGLLNSAAYPIISGLLTREYRTMPRDNIRESTAVEQHDARRDPERDHSLAHRLAARRFYREAPPYCVQFEENGTVTLRRKTYEY